MADLQEEFDAYLKTQQESKAFQLQKEFEAYQKDLAGGGSIRQGYPGDQNENPPYGATAGAMTGATVGAALAGPPGAMIGAGIGAVGGQFVQGRIEMAKGDKLAPRNFDDELYRMQREGAVNFMLEGAGQGIAWLYPKVRSLAPYASAVRPEAMLAQQNLERMTGQHNPFFMPAEMTSSRTLDILHNMAEYGILSGNAIDTFKHNRDLFWASMAKSIVDRYGPQMRADDIGRAVVESAQYNLESSKKVSKMIYDAIESQAAPVHAKAPAKVTVEKELGKAEAQEATKASEAFGESLLDFLRGKGGIQDQGGEIGRLEIKNQAKPGGKALVRSDGMTLDQAAEAAVEAGYLQERDVNSLIQAIESESRGKPVYSAQKGNEALQSDIYEQEFNEQFDVKPVWQYIQDGEQLTRMRVLVTEQENQISGTRVDLRPIKKQFEQAIRTSKEAGGLADQPMGNTLMTWLESKADLVSYPVAKAIRTEVRVLQDMLAKTPETKNAPAIGKAQSLYAALTKQIEKGLADDDPFLAEMWKEANLIEAGANQQFNHKYIRELVKLAETRGANTPEAIVEKVWNEKKVTPLKMVRNAVSPENWRKMQQIQMERLWTEAMPNGVPDSKAMQRAFFGDHNQKVDLLEAGFDRATVKELQDLHAAIALAQERQSEGTGRVLVQLQQARYGAEAAKFMLNTAGPLLLGAGYATDDPKLSVLGAGIILGPYVVAKLSTTPGGIRWLTEGLRTSPKSAKGIALATNILRALQAEGVSRTMPPDSERLPTQQLQNVQ